MPSPSASDVMKTLSDLTDRVEKEEQEKWKDIAIERTGNKIILPAGMTYKTAQRWLKSKEKEEETEVQISEIIEAFPLDGAVCFAKVLQKKYGWTNLVPTPGFFGDKPPALIGVEIGPGKTAQVPWGRCVFPGIEGYLETSWATQDGKPVFRLTGVVKRKNEKDVHELADDVRRTVKESSIYRGKAIKINFRNSAGDRVEDFDPFSFAPKFIDCSKVRPEQLIFSKDTKSIVQTTLFTPIEQSAICRQHGIPLKRGVLLEGPYGTGKTLTAYVLSLRCVENGWTFLYLEDVRDLDLAVALAKLYEPTVIFAEDVDRAVGEERDSAVDKILNTLDGVDSKDHDLIVVLTTNDVESINPAFVRPGRIDAVIHVSPPDNEATMKLVRLYGRDLVKATDEELLDAVNPIVGQNAAVIREVVERAKLAAIDRIGRAHENGNGNGELYLKASDIEIAAKTMKQHIELLAPKVEEETDDLTGFTNKLGDRVGGRLDLNRLGEAVASSMDINRIAERVGKSLR